MREAEARSGTDADLAAVRAAARALPLPPGARLAAVPVLAEALVTPPAGWRWPVGFERAVAKRRAEYLAGRRAAALALLEAGLGEGLWPERGGDSLPVWPSGWIGSISHERAIAVSVVAPEASCNGIGIDLEPLIAAQEVASLASAIMPEGLPPLEDGALALTRVFSAKEALFKSLFPQLRQMRGFAAARAELLPDNCLLTLTEDWGAGWPEGRRIEVAQVSGGGRILSLALV